MLLLLLPALAALAPPPALAAESAAPVELEYTVNAEDPALAAEGKVQILWRASGFRDRITAFCVRADPRHHEYGIASFGPLAPQGPWEDHPSDQDTAAGRPECSTGYRALVKEQDSVSASWVLDVRRPAFSACGCEFNSYLSGQWGVVKAEALSVPFSYAYFLPAPTFHATVKFRLPPGWSAEAPWKLLGPNHYELPGTGPPLPRGFFVLGPFTPELRDERASIGKEFAYVRLAAELTGKASLFEYLKKATPYYQGVYGDVTGDRVLVVSAGPPMFTGGLGSTDSLFVHQNSSQETIAHEYAHVWQRFQTVDDPQVAGGTALWVNEGDADLHGALSRFVTETQPGFTLARLNREFRESYDENSVKADMKQPLNVAAYGQPFEQVAYKKGLFTLLFLGQELERISNRTVGLNDVLRELNAFYETTVANRPGERRMTNQDVLDAVNKVLRGARVNVDMQPFFDRYVFGPDWPPYREVPAEVPVVFDALEVSPDAVEPGGILTARVQVTNVRDQAETRTVELVIDDEPVQQRTVTLRGLETQPVTFSVAVRDPGPHVARVAYLRQDFRVLTPAELRIETVAPLAAPQEGVAFDLAIDVVNAGEARATATVNVTLAGVAKSAEVAVEGGGRGRARLPFLVAQQGEVPAEVSVAWGNRSTATTASIAVGPRDRDLDGTPDSADAFPDDPRLSEPGIVNDLRSKTPGFGALAAVAALGLLALAARRRA